MPSSSKKVLVLGTAIIAIALLCCPYFLYAAQPNLQGSEAGQVNVETTVNPDGTVTHNITVTPDAPDTLVRAHWDGFSSDSNETYNISQTLSNLPFINYDESGAATQWYGTLIANIPVWLLNAYGVNIQPGAVINAPAFIASALNVDFAQSDFLNNKYVFKKFEGAVNAQVLNQGRIVTNGGYVALLSGAVENQGMIVAQLGTVVLASGEEITLALDDLNQISVVVNEAVKSELIGLDGKRVTNAIKNSGTITADGGRVILTAKVLKDVFDYAINNTGIIQATSVENHNGVIELVATGAPVINSGSLIANKVKISALGTDFINIGNIITDGYEGLPNGGRISIEAATILQQGKISANAFEGGTAGEVSIVSQTQTTLDSGSTTEAKALGLAGNGGRILIDSTGGNTVVNKNAVIDVSAGAVSGNAGYIEVGAFEQLGFYGVLNGRAPPGYTAATVLFDPDSDITIGSPINQISSYTASASGYIYVNASIIVTGGSITLIADNNSVDGGDVVQAVGTTISASNDVTISGANVVLYTVTAGRDISVTATVGYIQVNGDVTSTGILTSISSLIIIPNGNGDSISPALGGSYIDVTTADDDATYVYEAANAYKKALYQLEDTTASGTINSVTVYIRVRATHIPSQDSAYTIIKSGGVVTNGTPITLLGTTYNNYSTSYTTKPGGGVWTWDGINALQSGVALRRPVGDAESRCTQVWVEVNYSSTSSVTGNIVFNANGDFTQAAGTTITANNGEININATNVTLAQLMSSGNVNIIATGSILDDNDDTTRIRADYIKLKATGDIGSFNENWEWDMALSASSLLDIWLGSGNLEATGQNIYIKDYQSNGLNFNTPKYSFTCGSADNVVMLINGLGNLEINEETTISNIPYLLLGANRDLKVNANITTGAKGLGIVANGNIYINANMSLSGQATVENEWIGIDFDADMDRNNTGNLYIEPVNITVNHGGEIGLFGSDVIIDENALLDAAGDRTNTDKNPSWPLIDIDLSYVSKSMFLGYSEADTSGYFTLDQKEFDTLIADHVYFGEDASYGEEVSCKGDIYIGELITNPSNVSSLRLQTLGRVLNAGQDSLLFVKDLRVFAYGWIDGNRNDPYPSAIGESDNPLRVDVDNLLRVSAGTYLNLDPALRTSNNIYLSESDDIHIGDIWADAVYINAGGSIYGKDGSLDNPNITASSLYLNAIGDIGKDLYEMQPDYSVITENRTLYTQVQRIYASAGGDIGYVKLPGEATGDIWFDSATYFFLDPGILNITPVILENITANRIALQASGDMSVNSVCAAETTGLVTTASINGKALLPGDANIISKKLYLAAGEYIGKEETLYTDIDELYAYAGDDIGDAALNNPGIFDKGSFAIKELLSGFNNGIPQFVTADCIDLDKVFQISKFRSGAGHDYSDIFENFRSMKHYFNIQGPASEVNIYSPIDGTITLMRQEERGIQIHIGPDNYPGFTVVLFHISPDPIYKVGDNIKAGQQLGVIASGGVGSGIDIAIGIGHEGGAKNWFKSFSYFDAMDDTVFTNYANRGISSGSEFIISKQNRDADPLTCVAEGDWFTYSGIIPNWVVLNGPPVQPQKSSPVILGNAIIKTEDDLIVGSILAETVNLTSNSGSIINGNGDSNNIIANNLSLYAYQGIGTVDDPLEIQVADLVQVLNNSSGDIVINNDNDELGIETIENYAGAVTITNTGDISLLGAYIYAESGPITLESTAGGITISAENNDYAYIMTSGDLSIKAHNNLYIDWFVSNDGSDYVPHSILLETAIGGDITIPEEADIWAIDDINIVSGRDLSIGSNNWWVYSDNGPVNLTAIGNIYVAQWIVYSGGDLTVSGSPTDAGGNPSIQSIIDAVLSGFEDTCTIKVAGGTYNGDVDLNQGLTLQLLGDLTLAGNLTISDENAVLDADNKNIVLTGNWNNSGLGTFTAGTGTVTFNGNGEQYITSGGSSFYKLVIANTSEETVYLEDALDIDGDLTIQEESTLDADGYEITIAGGWFNDEGYFIHDNNTVTFDGSVLQQVTTGGSGSVFNILTITNNSAAGVQFMDALYTGTLNAANSDGNGVKLLTFAADSGIIHVITANFNVNGSSASGGLIQLRGSPDGTQWNINPQGAINVSYVDVKDSNNLGSLINPSNSVDSFNNTNWFDTTPPSFTIGYYTNAACTTPFTNNYMKTGTYYIKITASEALSAAPTISIDAEGSANDVTNASTGSLSGNDYVYTRTIVNDVNAIGSVAEVITITGTDSNGNTATNADVRGEKFTDTTSPVVTITTPGAAWYRSVDTGPTTPANLPPGAYGVVEDNPGSVVEDGYLTTEGPHTYTVTATDLAGNSGTASVTYFIDNTLPVVTITAPLVNDYKTSTVPALAYDVDEARTYTVETSGWSDTAGEHTATVTVTDKAGNSGTASVTYFIDNTAPVITIASPTDGTTYNTPQTLTYRVLDNLDPSPVLGGPASGTIYNTLGTHSILLTATDLAGNSGSATLSFTIEMAAFTESQLSNAIVFRLLLPSLEQLAVYRINTFSGAVYFYHPLTPIDMSAFDKFILEEGAYEFIDGAINIIGHEDLLRFLLMR